MAEPATEAVIGEWRPRSLRPPSPPWFSRPARSGLMAAVIVLHALALAWLLPLLDAQQAVEDRALLAAFVLPAAPETLPAEVLVIPMPDLPAAGGPAVRKRPRVDQPLQALPTPHSKPAATVETEPPGELELYGSDGRLKLPPDLLDQLDRKFGDKRVFSYQIPRMDDGAKLWNRPQAVVFEDTRFSQYWKPDQDILTAVLTEMVEKTTQEVRIKLPGRSNSTLVCKVSLLALGGGCGVLTPGADYVGPVDDPNTLSPEEDRQCQAWWEQIVGAKTQDIWRQTRKLYEESCRKPLERKPAG